MKTNKWMAVIALGGLMACGPVAMAQDKPDAKPEGGQGNRREQMKERGAKMAEELKLTDAQKAQVKVAMKEQADKAKALRDDTNLTPEDRRAKMKELRSEMDTKMKSILTAEQYEKWQKIRPQGGPGGPNGGPKGERKGKGHGPQGGSQSGEPGNQ